MYCTDQRWSRQKPPWCEQCLTSMELACVASMQRRTLTFLIQSLFQFSYPKVVKPEDLQKAIDLVFSRQSAMQTPYFRHVYFKGTMEGGYGHSGICRLWKSLKTSPRWPYKQQIVWINPSTKFTAEACSQGELCIQLDWTEQVPQHWRVGGDVAVHL